MRRLFLDNDGLLANFDDAAVALLGMTFREWEQKVGPNPWDKLHELDPLFFRNLPLMPGARKLFNSVKHLNPTILTGCTPEFDWIPVQKREWGAEHFPGTPVITCRSRDKRLHMSPGDVLVDDWTRYRHLWEEAGGIFVHFQGDTDATISQVLSLFEAKEEAA